MRLSKLILLVFASCFFVSTSIAQEDSTLTVHVVQRGENLYRISLGYGLTVDELARANGINNPNSIVVGQRLIIPVQGTQATGSLQEVVHILQPGETLASVANLYQVDMTALATLNNIADLQSVYVGQLLSIPNGDSPPVVVLDLPLTPTLTATPQEIADAGDTAPVRDVTDSIIHIVARGENLGNIARSYGVDASAIISANQIQDPSLIYPGQQMIIPGIQPPQYSGALPAPILRFTVAPLVFVEGRTGRIDFATDTPVTATGQFMNAPLRIVSQNGNMLHTIFIGIPVGSVAGIFPLTLALQGAQGESVPMEVNLQVTVGSYRTESLTIANDLLSLINANVDEAELVILRQVMGSFTPERYFTGLMGLPVAAPVSSPFGNQRSYNAGVFANTHTGTDFAAQVGSSIIAPSAGRVVLADTLNVRGVATVIDHGWGIYTGYWHQTERYVNLGDMVAEGQVIGTVGSTGRVTGAHLHWELWVNGVPVDPMQWVSEPLGL